MLSPASFGKKVLVAMKFWGLCEIATFGRWSWYTDALGEPTIKGKIFR
jgi:hypothetical protein